MTTADRGRMSWSWDVGSESWMMRGLYLRGVGMVDGDERD